MSLLHFRVIFLTWPMAGVECLADQSTAKPTFASFGIAMIVNDLL